MIGSKSAMSSWCLVPPRQSDRLAGWQAGSRLRLTPWAVNAVSEESHTQPILPRISHLRGRGELSSSWLEPDRERDEGGKNIHAF